MRAEDLIVEVDGTPIGGVDDLQRLMVAELIGQRLTASVVRAGRLVRLELVPVELTV